MIKQISLFCETKPLNVSDKYDSKGIMIWKSRGQDITVYRSPDSTQMIFYVRFLREYRFIGDKYQLTQFQEVISGTLFTHDDILNYLIRLILVVCDTLLFWNILKDAYYDGAEDGVFNKR